MPPTTTEYLEAIRRDGDRLIAAARDHLDDPVPWCPGWKGRDVVAHTAIVHRHKLQIVAELLREGPEPPTPPEGDEAVLAWYREGLDAMLETLASAGPDLPVWTWYPPDQTAGFWIRRMAHETAIHRADAESTSGPITPLPPMLAADGVDELMGPIMCGYTTDPFWGFSGDGRSVELRMPDTGIVRRLEMGTGRFGAGWIYGEGAATDPVAVLTAPASDMDLWAWGRAGAGVLEVDGDASVIEEIRSLAADATQ